MGWISKQRRLLPNFSAGALALLLLLLLLRSRLRALAEGHSGRRVAGLTGLEGHAGLAILLHLKLALLHFLKHLLWRFHARLVGSGLLLLSFGSLLGSFFDGFVGGIGIGGIGCGGWRRRSALRGLGVGRGGIRRFGYQHDANQQAGIFW
jgi:hypothetical protein